MVDTYVQVDQAAFYGVSASSTQSAVKALMVVEV